VSAPSSSSVAPTAEGALLARMLHRTFDQQHRRARTCGGCGVDLMTTGLPAIAYTFESCTCGTPKYSHLIERLWHRRCLAQEAVAEAARLKELEAGRVR
jgi:hypothetical protein